MVETLLADVSVVNAIGEESGRAPGVPLSEEMRSQDGVVMLSGTWDT